MKDLNLAQNCDRWENGMTPCHSIGNEFIIASVEGDRSCFLTYEFCVGKEDINNDLAMSRTAQVNHAVKQSS